MTTASLLLVEETCLAALRHWLAVPGSDVEKSLRRAMRARHAELGQEERKQIADRVLGAAVLRGRMEHLLARALGPSAAGDAEFMLKLFCLRERPGSCALCDKQDKDHERLQEAAVAPLFHADERPAASERLASAWSLPRWLAGRWLNELGPLDAFCLGRAMIQPARVTLRANVLKTTRLELMQAIASAGVRAVPTAESPWGLVLPDGRPPGGGVWQLLGWEDGRFEVQDEGSQLIVLATEAVAGERVLDYCAGRGGKTWALAALVAPQGRVLAWDIDAASRKQLQGARAARAGAEGLVSVCSQRPRPGSEEVAELADVVLVDAPCSCSGSLRRHPSQRWAIEEASIAGIAAQQLQILQEAATLVRPGGRLVYATCSLLQEENGDVASAFEAASAGTFEPWPLDRRKSHHRTLLPHVEGTDGFFMARWRRKG